GDIVDFAQADAWPRFTMNATPISFDNDVAYAHYQVLFPAVRDAGSANSMQIAEVELLGVPTGPVGHWKLDEGEGAVAVDSSGRGNDGTISNLNGGLGPDGSVWVDDPVRGTVISFNGTADGAFVRAGNIPQMTLTNDFTWAFWAKHNAENTADNDIILGNRMDKNGVDFVPRQFIKFTPTKFEWHMNGNGDDNLDYDDIPADVWLHHAVVKTADQLTYYRNGIEASSGTFTQPLDFPQPLFFGGDNEGAEGENWSGLMSDVRIYDRALSADEISRFAGPIVHYKLDDGEGVIAVDSSNGLDGILMGDPQWAIGIIDGALDFDGDGDYVDCGTNDVLNNLSNAITVSAWVNIRSVTTTWMGIVMKGETAWRLGVNGDTTGIHWGFTGGDRGWQAANSVTELPLDEWHHIAATYDKSVGGTNYVDGVAETVNPDPDGVATNEMPLLLGENPEALGRLFDGLLDDVRIYDRALSADELLELATLKIENLLQNPSFEEDEPVLDDPDWVSWCTWNPAEGAGSNATIVDTEAIDGTRSLLVEPKGVENWHFILVNISFPANLDKNYTASFWAKAIAPRPLTVQMKASDNSVDAWGATDFELTTEWTEYTYTSEVLHQDVKLEFLCAGSELPFWLDLVSVYEAH
ncbi:MAG TPA: LamG-like jellyroll fold domain-containing protein, partial [Sedimentisphaerales bacterium]|nr:LamG-like jellyroll fold domain-containing protein [Sedimentisphaerales bacterium]